MTELTQRPAGTARAPKAVSKNLFSQYVDGLFYPLEGLAFIRRHGLWRLAFFAIVVNVLLLGGLVALGVYFVWPWLTALDMWLAGFLGGASQLWQTLAALLTWLVWFLVLVLVMGVAGVVLLLVGQAVASPFLDLLSERIETLVLGVEPAGLTVRRLVDTVLVSLGDLVWGLVYYAGVQVPLLLLGLIPVIGTGPAAVLSFGFAALLLAQEFVGLSLTRHLVSYRARWRAVMRNKWSCLGFGTTAMALLFVPGVNLVLLPVAAAGGTLLYCDLRAAGRLEAAGVSLTGR